MKQEDIYEALQRIQPDERARERMLAHILSTAELERQEPPPRRRRGPRWMVLLAAVLGAVVGLTVAAAAYETDFFGLWNIDLGRKELTVPEVEADGAVSYHTEERDMISLQGLAGSPEYQANAEWQEFLESYDQDGALLAAVGNSPTGIPADYDAYTCYTWEMVDKLDEICEKYGLRLLGPATVEVEPQALFANAGVGDVCNGPALHVINQPCSGYWYQDGTFFFEGDAALAERKPGQIVSYQFSRAVRGSFNSVLLNIGNLADYEQWGCTTENGVPLLLASDHRSKALVIADLEQSFVAVNILGSADGFHMTNQDVEDFAEAFDFTVIP